MKRIKNKHLIIGKIYSDIPISSSMDACIFRLVKQANGNNYFKLISGPNIYVSDENGLYLFSIDSDIHWFQITKFNIFVNNIKRFLFGN